MVKSRSTTTSTAKFFINFLFYVICAQEFSISSCNWLGCTVNEYVKMCNECLVVHEELSGGVG